MKCKFCQGDLDSGVTVCPHCGKDNSATEETASQSVGMGKTKLVLAICAIAAVALLGIGLIMITLFGIRGGWESLRSPETTPAASSAPETTPEPTEFIPGEGVLQFQSYSVSDEDALAKGDVVVATMGEHQLTNRQLQMYYWNQFYEMWSYYYSLYGDYITMLGLDYSKPLDSQPVAEGPESWQHIIMESGLNTWNRYRAWGNLAVAAGHQMSEDFQKELDTLEAGLASTAQDGGYTSIEDMLQKELGAGVTFEDYKAYTELYYLSLSYMEYLQDTMEVSQADLEAYYEANKDAMAESGITKESGNMADVRHILIMPEGGTDVEGSAYKSYTDDEWAACQAEAQRILDEWLAGDATEESFIALTGKYTQDTGYASNGGLYTSVMKNSGYVESFENWAADPENKAGAYGLVKTEYGYHIMYTVESWVAWEWQARQSVMLERCNALIDAELERVPMEVDYSKIGIAVVSFN